MISCEQIAQRAKGRNAVDYYEEGMTPLLSYMFFVLHYHQNVLTTEGLHKWPIIPHSKMRHFTDRVVFARHKSGGTFFAVQIGRSRPSVSSGYPNRAKGDRYASSSRSSGF